MKIFYSIKKDFKSFGILLRPQAEKIKAIKKRLKMIIKRILHEPRDQMYKAFRLINSVLLSWGSYYYFNQGCEYGKRLDNFVFICLKKVLVKKFRYNGLLRPKWVAYNFLGLDKINPNGRKWQPRAAQYSKNLLKVVKYAYIWLCSDSFNKLSITSLLLNPELRKKNYYAFRDNYDKNLIQLATARLKPDLKVKLYHKQGGLCWVCNETIIEHELLTRSSKINVHYMLSSNVSKDIAMMNKSYTVCGKVLLHDKCRLTLYKSKFFVN
jgi:hypothetical protein